MPAAAVATYLLWGEAAEKKKISSVMQVVFTLCVPHLSEIRGRVASRRFAGREGAARHRAGIRLGRVVYAGVTRPRLGGDISVTF